MSNHVNYWKIPMAEQVEIGVGMELSNKKRPTKVVGRKACHE